MTSKKIETSAQANSTIYINSSFCYCFQNILVRPKQGDPSEFEVFSLIDYGDSQFNPLIYELAITIMYMMVKPAVGVEPVMAGGHVLAGYLTLRQLPAQEMDILRVCVAAR